jgi:hypothetical protein
VGRGSRARGGGRRGAQQLLELKREWGGRENGGSGAGAAWKEGNGRERGAQAHWSAVRFQTRFELNKNSNGSKPISNSFKLP